MIIRNLFKKDINRSINGVVKADQVDNEVVWQELDEYVVTPDIKEHLKKFFSAYCESVQGERDPSGSNGCWISGFFGSGKSHFLKILAYLLGNKPVSFNGETRKPIQFFSEKPQCKDSAFFKTIQQAAEVPCDAVLFNIDSKSDSKKGKDAILRVFMNVFNGLCGYSDIYPHLANIERMLDAEGQYQAFQEEFENITKKSWKKHRKAYFLMLKQTAQAVSNVIDQNPESMEQTLTDKNSAYTLTIEGFAKTVKEYLNKKSKNHRIVFLVDEIGQYIGKNSDLMLNLQTITENLGTLCEGGAWVAVTSQENLEGVLGEVSNRQNQDFSKIQGRFVTRLSFASNQAHQVIQNRILEKKDQVQPELSQLYSGKGDILRNQLSFVQTGMTLKSFKNETDFADHYPFIPYQYKLIQKVFQKLRDVNITGGSTSRGERSMLNAFQLAVVNIQDKNLGALVPFWRFYAAIKETLDTIIKKTIQEAMDSSLFDEFDIQVLKTLFLIRYVDEIPGSVDNLMTLSISMIDEDKKILRQKIEKSLQKLERETLVNRVGEEFFFLTNEEKDIRNEIKSVTLDAEEDSRALSAMVFFDILGEWKAYRYSVNNQDFQFNRLCDGQRHGQVANTDISLSMITPLSDDYGLWLEDGKCCMHSDTQLIVRWENSNILIRELNTFLKTDKFLSKNHSESRASKKLIIEHIRGEHREHKTSLLKLIRKLLFSADIFGVGKKLDISNVKVTKGESKEIARLGKALRYLIENKYNKLTYIETEALDDRSMLKEIRQILTSLADNIQGDFVDNKRALEEVEEYLKIRAMRQQNIKLKEVIDNFEGMPYGWNKYEAARLLARLFVQGSIEFIGADKLSPEQIADVFGKPSLWPGVVVKKRKKADEATIKKAVKIGVDIFEVSLPKDEKDLAKEIGKRLEKWLGKLKVWQRQAMDGNPGEARIQESLSAITGLVGMSNSADLLKTFCEKRDDLEDGADFIEQLDNFYKNQKPVWDKLKRATAEFKLNESYLRSTPELAAKLDDLISIENMESPFGRLKDVSGLVDALRSENERLIETSRRSALPKAEETILRVKDEIEKTEAEEISNKCLYPLQQIKLKIQEHKSIPHIEAEVNRLFELEDRALALIEELGGKRQEKQKKEQEEARAAAKKKSGAKHEELAVKTKENPPPVMIKTRAKINPITILGGKIILETQEDVEEYLAALRDSMEKIIKDGKRIQITG